MKNIGESELVEVKYVIPNSLVTEIADKINESVRDAYFWNVTKAISNAVIEKLEEEEFISRVADTVIEKITMSEEEYVEGVAKEIKETLMKTTGIIANEVLEKVSDRVKSYGFIRIGDR